MKRTVIAAWLALAVLSPVSAVAQTGSTSPEGVAPPGVSGASQYQEDLPTAKGGEPVTQVKAHHGHSNLSSKVVHKLDSSGSAGQAAAAIAQATAPTSSPRPAVKARHVHRRHGSKHSSAATLTAVPPPIALDGSGSGPFAAVVDALTGGDGMGALLPILLLASSIAVAIAAFVRRGRR